MTPSEAVQKAVENHEFRHYRYADNILKLGAQGVVAECWCGAETPPFLNEQSARDAHGRHQTRLALMRSFGHWDV